MASTTGVVMASGTLAFIGSFKEAGGFPDNGYAIIGGTTALTFLASTVEDSVIARPVKAFAYLVLLGAALRYVPGLFGQPHTTRKKVNNG